MFTPTIKLEHADARGEIYSIALPDNRELMLLHSKAGAFRGGHSHTVDEIVVLLSGKMDYHKLIYDVDVPEEMGPGVRSYNPAGLVHMGKFLEDCWVVEYKFAEKDSWTQTDYEPWREKVRESADIEVREFVTDYGFIELEWTG